MISAKGFTLTELITSLVIVSIGLLAVATISLYGFSEFQFTKARIETEAEALRLQYFATSFFGQAINADMGNPTAAGGGNIGRVLQFNYVRMADAPSPLRLIAKFYRESGGRGTNVAQVIGEYRASSIWWVRPTPTTSGVLVFDYGPDPSGPGPYAMRPSFGDQYISRLTELQIVKEAPNTGDAFNPEVNRLGSVQIRAKFRYFHPSGGQTWCPMADINAGVANCRLGIRLKEFERSFRVTLRNNVIRDTSPTGSILPERPLGLLHFFNPAIPARGW